MRCVRASPAPSYKADSISLQINEAFASQFAYCVEELGIPMEKINPKYVDFPTLATPSFLA